MAVPAGCAGKPDLTQISERKSAERADVTSDFCENEMRCWGRRDSILLFYHVQKDLRAYQAFVLATPPLCHCMESPRNMGSIAIINCMFIAVNVLREQGVLI